MVDLDAEIAKCNKKLDVARMNAEKIIKMVAVPDYETTVPENVRETNAEKVSSFDCYSVVLLLTNFNAMSYS